MVASAGRVGSRRTHGLRVGPPRVSYMRARAEETLRASWLFTSSYSFLDAEAEAAAKSGAVDKIRPECPHGRWMPGIHAGDRRWICDSVAITIIGHYPDACRLTSEARSGIRPVALHVQSEKNVRSGRELVRPSFPRGTQPSTGGVQAAASKPFFREDEALTPLYGPVVAVGSSGSGLPRAKNDLPSRGPRIGG